MVQSLATTVTEMAEGEVAQLERAGNPDATVEDYFRVIDRKTASLIAWCARVGGSVGAALAAPLERYGRALGRAFQIADDVLDSAIDEATAGKSVGPRPAGGQADAAGAAGVRGRPGAGPAHPRAAGRAGRPGGGGGRDPRRRAGRGRRRPGAPQGGARWPTRRSARWRPLPASPLPRRAARRSPICPRTGAPDVARSGDGDARRRSGAAARRRSARPRTGRTWRRSSASSSSAAQLERITREVDPEPGGQRDRAAGDARGRAGAAVRAGRRGRGSRC